MMRIPRGVACRLWGESYGAEITLTLISIFTCECEKHEVRYKKEKVASESQRVGSSARSRRAIPAAG
jgi:hypothetical protein